VERFIGFAGRHFEDRFAGEPVDHGRALMFSRSRHTASQSKQVFR
jgi:hypothetical protein